MNNERFTIPELLFHPSNIGMNQAGIPETIVESVSLTHSGTLYWKFLNSPVKISKRLIYVTPCFINRSDLHGLFYSNIVLVGGNASFPGYKERM